MMDQARTDPARCLAATHATQADPATCAAHLHEAAGVAALIGAKRLHGVLQQAEQACRVGDRVAIRDNCAALADVWTETERGLAEQPDHDGTATAKR